MKKIFQGKELTIRKSFFGQNVIVINHLTGAKKVASLDQVGRCSRFLDVQAQLDLSAVRREFVTTYIFERFGMAVLFPESLPAKMFMEGDGQRLLNAAVLASDPDAQAAFESIKKPFL